MIPLFKPFMCDEVDEELSKVLHSGYIGQGPKVEEFEEELGKVFHSDYVVTVNTGTSGLHLAIHMVKDEWGTILATPLTCTATNWPILANECGIRWVDVDKTNLNMDLDDLARKIDKHTRVIVFVHWGGVPIDYAKLNHVLLDAKAKFGFMPAVIEDCAHAMGAEWNGKPISQEDCLGVSIKVYSFQAIKQITSIDGGAIVFPNEEMYKRAKLLRWYGIDRETNKKDMRCEDDVKEWGFKFHMNDINATIGLCNLKYFDDIKTHVRMLSHIYDDYLIPLNPIVKVQAIPDEAVPAWWLYTILADDREKLAKYLTEEGIMVSKVHERNDKHTCVKDYKALLPTLDKIEGKILCIPIGYWVTEDDAHYIGKKIREFYDRME